MNCNCVNPKPKCSEVNGITIVIIPESLGDDSQDSIYAPTVGAYKNTVVKYLANGYVYVYDKDGAYTMIGDSDAVDITVDQILDVKSKNAIANQAVSKALAKLAETVATDYAELSGKTADLDERLTTLDGSLAKVAKTGDYRDLTNKPVVDTELSTASRNAVENRAITTAINAEKAARESADAGIRSDVTTIDTAINKDVITDIKVDPTPSTTLVNLDATKTNIKTSTSTTSSFPLPVASSTQAGVINSATYDSIRDAIQLEQAVVHGAVAITGMPMNPTQQEITDAWKVATGLTELVNRAEVYDVSHNKVWTYYQNDNTWHATSNTTQVTVQQFTNSSLGTIQGSTINGQIYAETNGTGSVNGWDTLTATVASSKSKLDTIEQGAEVNVQADWNQTTTTADDYIKNKPDLSAVATSGSYSDLTDKPIDSNTDVGNNLNPMFVKDGVLTASVGNVGTKYKPIYMSNGVLTASDATVGDSKTPVYMNAGTITAMDELANVAFSGDYNDLINTPGGGADIDTTILRKLEPNGDDTEIENGEDLNDATYRQIGTYYCKTDATAAQVTNAPTAKAFKLETFSNKPVAKSDIETTAGITLIQRFSDNDGKEYFRTLTAETAGNFTYTAWKMYVDGSVGTDAIADDAITAAKIKDGEVNTAEIADSAVTTGKIANSAVTTGKIADGAVTSAKITTPIKKTATSSWIKARDNALVVNTNPSTTGSWAPVVDVKSKTGDWSIGVLDNSDALRFSWATDANYASNTNTSKAYYLSTDGTNNFVPNMSLAADKSIATAKLADSAVTNAKLASSAVKPGNVDWSSMVTSITSPSALFDSQTVSVASVQAFVIGKLFILQRLVFNNHNVPYTETGQLVATLKSAYRPTGSNVRIPVQMSSDLKWNIIGIVGTDGKITESASNSAITSKQSFYASTCWRIA